MKICEVCQKEIPEDYSNLLCDEHYRALEAENTRLKALAEEDASLPVPEPKTPVIEAVSVSGYNKNGITNPNYQENPEMEDKEQWATNLKLFERHGVLLWKPTRQMYTFIKNYCLEKVKQHPQYPKFIWRPKIADVGCGLGAGSNVLSQEADFTWGIDKNEKSIMFAKEAFERIKNGIYYSSEVKFDVFDIIKDTRETMKFDVVVAIEVIEHIFDYKTFLVNLITKFDKRKDGYEATEYFISTPNRNNKSIQKDRPFNKYHVREHAQEETIAVLSEFFTTVELFNSAGVPQKNWKEEDKTTHTPLLFKCSGAKI